MDDLLILYSEQLPWLQATIGLAALFLVAAIVNFILKQVILRAAAPILERKSRSADRAATWLATVAPLLVLSRGIALVPYLPGPIYLFVSSTAQALVALSVAMAIVKTLSYVNEIYERRPESRNRPIKGFLQVIKILVLSGAAVMIIAILIDESPLLLLSGLGAITAVLLLVFKDTILSLVASVQLTTNDMLRVGDWITMPDMNADGDVIDISLHTVKVQNFDKTLAYIPTHRLVSDSYVNWRGMSDSGSRRIKRAIPLDQNSIRFLTKEEVEDLKRFRLLRDFLARKQEEIDEWNEKQFGGDESLVNARRITNIGVLRAYATAYMTTHPHVTDEGFTLMVRQLDPTPLGLPLEFYCFASTTEWTVYEEIQSDIFDHMMAIIPEFGLRVFQEPSGLDVRDAPAGKGAA